ncbi:hypothetical protein ACFE04_012728 [Oxalis oulophora]
METIDSSPQTPVPKKRGRKPKSKEEDDNNINISSSTTPINQSQTKMKDTPTNNKRSQQQQASIDDKYTQWKSLVPILYDWLANHNLVWPSLSCRWGPQLDKATYKNRQRLYLSEQTDGSVPNTLVIANCEIVKPRVAAAEHISQFNEEARSPFVKKYKTIIHPGEVNRIRELPQNSKIVATHTDSPDVRVLLLYSGQKDLCLKGHVDNAEFALAMCPTEPFVLAQEFCSVGDDSCLILWDARVGTNPVVKVEKAHDGDLHCVDWNPHNNDFILTGSADHSVRMFDRRKLTANGVGEPVNVFEGHKAAVLCVQWSPDKSSVFGSSAEDGLLNVWDYEKVGKQDPGSKTSSSSPAGLFFQHAGHRDKVVDFHWNTADPWTIVSVSDDCDTTGGGGTLQIWRMSDLIYRPEDEVLEELEKFKAHVVGCNEKKA